MSGKVHHFETMPFFTESHFDVRCDLCNDVSVCGCGGRQKERAGTERERESLLVGSSCGPGTGFTCELSFTAGAPSL